MDKAAPKYKPTGEPTSVQHQGSAGTLPQVDSASEGASHNTSAEVDQTLGSNFVHEVPQFPLTMNTLVMVGNGVMLEIASKAQAQQKSVASQLTVKNMTSLSQPSVNGTNLFLPLQIEAMLRPSTVLSNVFKNLYLQILPAASDIF